MADISKVTLLDGNTYDLKDANAIPKPSSGSTGDVLTKTANGQEWATPAGGSVSSVNNIQPDTNKNVQTVVELTQAQYDALVSGGTVDSNVTYLITDAGDFTADKKDFTLYSANWNTTTNVYTISDAHIDTDTIQTVVPAEGITDSQLEALQGANIQAYGQDAGHLYLKAYGDLPSIDVPISIIFQQGVTVREVDPQKQEIYSTTETVVGTWIDGKPIYRKVFTGSDVSLTTTTTIDSTLTSLTTSTITKLYSIERFSTGNTAEWFPSYPFTSSDLVYPVVDSGGVKLRITNKTVTAYVIIVEYTKTTD